MHPRFGISHTKNTAEKKRDKCKCEEKSVRIPLPHIKQSIAESKNFAILTATAVYAPTAPPASVRPISSSSRQARMHRGRLS